MSDDKISAIGAGKAKEPIWANNYYDHVKNNDHDSSKKIQCIWTHSQPSATQG